MKIEGDVAAFSGINLFILLLTIRPFLNQHDFLIQDPCTEGSIQERIGLILMNQLVKFVRQLPLAIPIIFLPDPDKRWCWAGKGRMVR